LTRRFAQNIFVAQMSRTQLPRLFRISVADFQGAANVSSSAFAWIRSGVSNPSLNQA
jgi:hypothetical protein